MSTTHNSLLAAWIVLKAQNDAPSFNTPEWLLTLRANIESEYEEATTVEAWLERLDTIEQELERELINTIATGHKTGNWPWR